MLSTREWKPGDVAMVKCSDGEWRRASYFEMTFDPPAWVFQDNSRRRVADSVARPLVVIDDEDREQVERLRDEYEAYRPSSTDLTAHMQAALRSLIAPPKPTEPTGLGAVVEDADGLRWVRDAEGRDVDGAWYRRGVAKCRHYADIATVKVLSEGVTS